RLFHPLTRRSPRSPLFPYTTLFRSAFTRVMPDSKVPDTQLLLAAAPLTAGPYFKPFKQPYQDAFGGRIIMLHPESRGTVSLASRSEEHTSELQSRGHLVCRLLLEKK